MITWKKWASYSPWSSSAGGKIKSYKKKRKKWKIHKTRLDITAGWDYIEWGKDGYITWWDSGSVSDSKQYGYIISVRKYKGSGWTPNPVIGMKISGNVGGHSYQF